MAKRSKSEWHSLFEEHDASGLSAAAFCRERGVDAKYFSVRKRQLTANSLTSFVEVKPSVDELAHPTSVSLRIIDMTIPLDCLAETVNGLFRREP